MPREERHNTARRKAKLTAKEFLYEYLQSHSCVDCGQTNPIVLTFDHITGIKKANVADLVAHGCSIRLLEAEIEKCEVVCFNCHSRREQKRRGMYRWRVSNNE